MEREVWSERDVNRWVLGSDRFVAVGNGGEW